MFLTPWDNVASCSYQTRLEQTRDAALLFWKLVLIEVRPCLLIIWWFGGVRDQRGGVGLSVCGRKPRLLKSTGLVLKDVSLKRQTRKCFSDQSVKTGPSVKEDREIQTSEVNRNTEEWEKPVLWTNWNPTSNIKAQLLIQKTPSLFRHHRGSDLLLRLIFEPDCLKDFPGNNEKKPSLRRFNHKWKVEALVFSIHTTRGYQGWNKERYQDVSASVWTSVFLHMMKEKCELDAQSRCLCTTQGEFQSKSLCWTN